MILYHGSDKQFSKFDRQYAVQEGRADNGYFGVHLTSEREIAKRFGKYLYTVEYDANTYNITIAEFSRMYAESAMVSDTKAFYDSHRTELLACGFNLVHIVENTEKSVMYIALDEDNLKILEVEESCVNL